MDFDSEISYGGRRVAGFGLGSLVTGTQIQFDIKNTVTLMDQTDAGVKACSSMSPSDTSAWTSIYENWQSWLSGLQECVDDLVPSIHTKCVNAPYGYTISAEWEVADKALSDYQDTARTWQDKIRLACPSFQPTPVLPKPGQGAASTWVDDIKTVGMVVGGIAVTGVIAYGAYEVIKIVAAASSKKR